ncbi:MAG: hypothetical protein ACI92I_000638 [Acidimicrobiales bacterium]|jgi:hypothetical protein
MEEENKKVDESGVTAPKEESDHKATQAGASAAKATTDTKKIWIVLAIIIGALLVFGVISNSKKVDTVDGQITTEKRDAEYVLATVNGEPILQKDLDERVSEAAQNIAAQGIDLNDATQRTTVETQILEDMIDYSLLMQAATESVLTIDTQEVDALEQGYIQQAGGEDILDAELAKIGFTRESLKVQISEQVRLQQYILQNTEVVEVKEEDARAFYESLIAGSGQEEAPAFEEIREQIASQLTMNAQQESVQSLVATLRASAEVTIN